MAEESEPLDWKAELQRAVDDSLSINDLVVRLNVSRTAIIRAEKKTGISIPRATGYSRMGAKPLFDWPSIFEKAIAEETGPYRLAGELGVALASVLDAERRYGVLLVRTK